MKHLSARAKQAKREKELIELSQRFARVCMALSRSSANLLMEIAEQMNDQETAASFRAKIEERINAKSQGAAPGDPFVAGLLLEYDERAKAILKQWQDSTRHTRKLNRDKFLKLNDEFTGRLASHEGIEIVKT